MTSSPTTAPSRPASAREIAERATRAAAKIQDGLPRCDPQLVDRDDEAGRILLEAFVPAFGARPEEGASLGRAPIVARNPADRTNHRVHRILVVDHHVGLRFRPDLGQVPTLRGVIPSAEEPLRLLR